jgi:WD40 repeat protein
LVLKNALTGRTWKWLFIANLAEYDRTDMSRDGALLGVSVAEYRQPTQLDPLVRYYAVVDTGSGRIKQKFTLPNGARSPAHALSADGQFIALGIGLDVQLRRTGSPVAGRLLKGNRADIRSATFSPDSTMLATGDADNTVSVWNVGDGQLIRTLNLGAPAGTAAESLQFSPDGSRLAVGESFSGGSLKLWRVR